VKFTPQDPSTFSDNDYDPMPPGEYDFEVAKATAQVSKASGSDMIKLELNVFKGDRQYKVWDYLVQTDKALYKIHQFCASVGLLKKYESGELTALDCEGKTGAVKIGIQPAKGDYEAKNVVKGYIAVEDLVKAKTQATADSSDEIPF
jgi:hypothetical protein